MTCGHIKCFFEAKGYGFIEDFEGHEVYFHYTVFEGANIYDIVNGATVYFETINTSLGLEASRVRMAHTISA